MIVIAKDGNRYLVKTNSADDKCYLVDLAANYVFDYDLPEKFLRFGYWEEFKEDKEIQNRIKQLLI